MVVRLFVALAVALGSPLLAHAERPRATLNIGDPMPHFTAVDLTRPDAAPVATRSLATDTTLAVSFVASYCKPCRAEVPQLLALAARRVDLDVILVVIDRDEAGLEATRTWLVDELKADARIVRDRFSVIARRFGVHTLPHVALFDRRRHLIWQGSGGATADLSPLTQVLDAARSRP